MDQLATNESWMAENISGSGRISESVIDYDTGKPAQGTKGDTELILMKLRRLSRTIMSKHERRRFEERKLCGTNVVKFLKCHLSHLSEKVRYLALELLCCTVPRLGNKVDSLLNPIMPKVFQCLGNNEEKDLKLKAIHFLRTFFRHAGNLSGFIDTFARLGLESEDPEAQIFSCHGLSIVFDQDIGNCLFSRLVVSLGYQLNRRKHHGIIRAAYRALRYIHRLVRDDRFYELLRMTNPNALNMYRGLFTVEESDSFLSLNNNDCSVLISTYQTKRRNLRINKDFGIFDPRLLDAIAEKRNCERAKAISNFTNALKFTMWSDEDLEPHIMDFLKLIFCFIKDSNRLIQVSGLDILKDVINRMGFVVSPYLHCIVEVLRESLISPNTLIKAKVKKVLFRFMRNTHPMTIFWELLGTKNSYEREAVLMLIQEKITSFSYHELDMIPLCNHVGQSLEDKNTNVSKCSRDTIILILDILRDCPVYDNRNKAMRMLLRNYKLKPETLQYIGIGGFDHSENYNESFESYSEEEPSEMGSVRNPVGSSTSGASLTKTRRSLSTAGKSDYRSDDYNDVYSTKSFPRLNETQRPKSRPKDLSINKSKVLNNKGCCKHEKSGNNCCVDFQEILKTPIKWEENSKTTAPEEVEDGPSMNFSDAYGNFEKSHALSAEPSSFPTCCCATPGSKRHFKNSISPEQKHRKQHSLTIKSKDFLSSFSIERTCPEEIVLTPEFPVPQNENCQSMVFSTHTLKSSSHLPEEKKCLTRFAIKTETPKQSTPRIDEYCVQGDGSRKDEISIQNLPIITNITKPSHEKETHVVQSYEQDGIQIDIMDREVFNFNIMQIEQRQNKNATVGTVSDSQSDKSIHSMNPLPHKKNKDLTLKNDIKSEKSGDRKEINPHEETFLYESDGPIIFEIESSEIPSDIRDTPNEEEEENITIMNKSECDDTELKDNEKSINKDLVNDVLDAESIDNKVNYSDTIISYISEHSNSTCEIIEEHVVDNAVLDELDKDEEIKCVTEVSISYCNDFSDNQSPFMPKNRQLPRTPVPKRKENILDVKPATVRKNKKLLKPKAKKAPEKEKKNTGNAENNENLLQRCKKACNTAVSQSSRDSKTTLQHNKSPSYWGGCQWKRDLDFASKGGTCPLADNFEKRVRAMTAFPSNDVAETEMKKALEDLYGDSWDSKEEAMLVIIKLMKYHHDVVFDNINKIAVGVSNEIKSNRQSIAAKAVITAGYIYELMGRNFDNKVRLILSALLTKAGNRTLAAYFRLVMISLLKITFGASPHKAAHAFIQEGIKHPSKASRETAAQFLVILTDILDKEKGIYPSIAVHMLRCVAVFVLDSSALTRYCGRKILEIMIRHPDFEKVKDSQLDIDTAQTLTKVVNQIKAYGVTNECLPVNIIEY